MKSRWITGTPRADISKSTPRSDAGGSDRLVFSPGRTSSAMRLVPRLA